MEKSLWKIVSAVVLLTTAVAVGPAHAENEALFDAVTGQLRLPAVAVGQTYYDVTMQLTTGLNFALTGATPITHVSSNSEIGSWWKGYNGTGTGELLNITFYNNGTYMHCQNGDAVNSNWIGIEYGTYAIDPTTHELTANVLYDQNGEVGFSHPSPGERLYVNVADDVMTLTNSVTPEVTTVYRVH